MRRAITVACLLALGACEEEGPAPLPEVAEVCDTMSACGLLDPTTAELCGETITGCLSGQPVLDAEEWTDDARACLEDTDGDCGSFSACADVPTFWICYPEEP